MPERLVLLLMRHRWLVAGAVLAATGTLGVYASRVGMDNTVDVWFVEGDPALKAYKEFQQTFGNDEVVAVAVVDDRGVWRPETLNSLRDAVARLEKVGGIKRVVAVTNAQLVAAGAADIEVHPATSGPLDAAGAVRLRAEVEADPLLAGRLVTKDGTTAMLFAQMDTMGDIDARRDGVLKETEAALEAALKPAGVTWHTAGIGVIYNALNVISAKEGALFMGAAFGLIFLLLWPLFRSFAAVAVCIGAVGSALVMTRGLYGLFGHDDNMVTLTLPVLVLVLGIEDCVYFLLDRAADPEARPEKVLGHVMVPCLFTSLTVMAGFASLATSQMRVVRDFGVYAAIGIGIAYVTTMAFCTFAFSFKGFSLRRPPEWHSGFSARALRFIDQVGHRSRVAIVAVSVLALLVCAYGMSKVEVDTYSLGFLPESHAVVRDTDAIEKRFGAFTPLEIVVTAEGKEAIETDPAILRGVLAFEQALKKDPEVRDAFSIADVAARAHQLQGDAGTPFEVAARPDVLAQDLLGFFSDPDSQWRSLTDAEKRTVRITASVPALSAKQYGKLIDRVLALARTTLPPSVTVAPSGYLPLYVKMMDYVVDSQVSSFGSAFVMVFVLIALLLRSIRLTALSVVPDLPLIIVTLGVMGFAGIHLDVATVTITSILMGVVVVNTIHYLHRYREALQGNGGDHEAASTEATMSVGPAMTSTTVFFTLGFLILAFASVKSIVYFGLLTALTTVVALAADILVLPAVLMLLKPRLLDEARPAED